MLLPGGKWESIERREKLYGVVFVHGGKSKLHFHISVCDSIVWPARLLLIAVKLELHIWPQLTKDNVQRSYLNFKEDEWLIYDVYFHFWRAAPLMGERGRRGFVIEVKNNKATACWPALPVQRPWYESNALCMPLRMSKDTGKHVAFDPAFLLLSFIWPILQNCH